MKHLFERLGDLKIEEVKEFLIRKFRASSWEDCVDNQKFGDCEKIVRLIYKSFPGVFDCIYDIDVDYSDIAIKKLHDLDDYGEMFGNHYVLSKDRILYDFCKGTNTISGVYLLTQYPDMRDKYDITLSNKEQSLIKSKIRRSW